MGQIDCFIAVVFCRSVLQEFYMSELRSTGILVTFKHNLFDLFTYLVTCVPNTKKNVKTMTSQDWQKLLTPEQYYVAREGGTEPVRK